MRADTKARARRPDSNHCADTLRPANRILVGLRDATGAHFQLKIPICSRIKAIFGFMPETPSLSLHLPVVEL